MGAELRAVVQLKGMAWWGEGWRKGERCRMIAWGVIGSAGSGSEAVHPRWIGLVLPDIT